MKEAYRKRTYLYFHLYEEQAKLAYSGKKSEYCLTLGWGWGLMGHWQEVTINVLLTDKGFIVAVRSLSHVPLFATPRTAAHQAFPSFTISRSLLRLMSIKSVMPSDHLNLCRPLLLLPSIFPSIRVFLNESAFHIRWPKYWRFSISPSNEYSKLIFLQINWFDLLAVQVTLKSLLQHHNLKASILCCSVFFRVQLSHPYMTTGKNIALTIRTFVSKVICLLFNMLSRFVIVFLPRSELLLVSRLHSPSAVILELKKIKSVTVSTFLLVFGMILVFGMLSFKPAFSLSSFIPMKRLFSSSSLSAIRVVSPAYLKLLIFLPVILIPACDSSSQAFHMMYSA